MTERHVRKTVNELIDDLKTVFTRPDEMRDMEMIEIVLMALSDITLKEKMRKALWPYKSQIVERDEKYFISNCAKIFSSLPAERVDHFNKVLRDPKRVDGETRGVIFDYLNVLIRLIDG